MLPITIDAARVRIALVGNGEAARRRLAVLDRAGASHVDVYADAAEPDLAAAAGDRLRRRLPSGEELARAQLVFLAQVGEPGTSQLRRIADSAGVLLNVEDDLTHSSFHSPAVVRRGDLTIAISTGGKSPGLAAALRRQIEAYSPARARSRPTTNPACISASARRPGRASMPFMPPRLRPAAVTTASPACAPYTTPTTMPRSSWIPTDTGSTPIAVPA